LKMLLRKNKCCLIFL